MSEAPPVAVTGAGGSLGTALVCRLARNGHPVRALVRSEEDALGMRELGATPVVGDLRDSGKLEELVRGCEVVFHLAAWMGSPFDGELAFSVNVGGTEDVVRAAAGEGVQRVVLASSIAVYGPVRDGRITEESPYWGVGDLYGDTKIEAEKAAKLEARKTGIELVIMRPTMIYGPDSPSWTKAPFAAISRGFPAVIGDGEDFADPVYVEDVARAFKLAAKVPEAAGEAFNVGAGPQTWNEFLGHYARMTGRPLCRMPAPLAHSGARVAERAGRLSGGRPRLVAEMAGSMTSRAVYPNEKARRLLGFEPEVSLEEGMDRTEEWLRREGLLRRPKVALVTGAAGGLGKATARKLRQEGLTVWATDIEAPGDLEGEGIHALALDVTSEASVEEALATILEESGSVDLVVNAAGLADPGPLEIQPFGKVSRQFEVNAYGPLRLVRAVAPWMRERGWGRIVNVSSTNGFIVTPFMGGYSASKYALEAFSDALRLELGPRGVEVAVVEPGAMKTPFVERAREELQRSISDTESGWGGYLRAFLESPLWGEGNANDPEKVAEVVVRVSLGRRCRPRRLATLDAIPARILSLLPTPVRDALLLRASGLHCRPRGSSSPGAKGRAASPPAGRERR